MELAVSTAMTKLGASLLEDLLGTDAGHRGPHIDCGAGHKASFASYRPKTLETVLSSIELNRAHYHCSDCHAGVVPRDTELGVAGLSLNPGLAAMLDRVGVAVPFIKGRDLLAELAGVQLSTKRVERCAETDGRAVAVVIDTHAAAVLTGELVPLGPPFRLPNCMSPSMAPGSSPCPPTPTDGPTSGKSNSACCSPKPAWTPRGSLSGTRTRPATCPTWNPSNTSVLWSTPKPSARLGEGRLWATSGPQAVAQSGLRRSAAVTHGGEPQPQK